jgi:hypothetical protein
MSEKRTPSPQEIFEIGRELAERRAREQAPREQLHLLVTGGASPEEIRTSPVVAEMRRIELENVAYLKTVVEAYGWPDAERFGAEATFAAFLIIQHCDEPELMGFALPFIEADVKAGRLQGGAYALLYDRYRLQTNRPQRFGSQVIFDAQGEPVAERLEDPEHVDERRKEFGLGPLASYLQRFARKK